ncbi:MAG: carbon monoxide dehydrogenase subunit G, partial [Pseudomonadota bacterium]
MKMTGERLIAAPRSAVWAALNDPEVLKASIPGCTAMEKTADDSFTATVTQKVGPVKATFNGTVALEDVVEAESYRIVGEGKGGAAGFAKGGATVRLSDGEAGTTHLHYEADAKVGGKIAQLGARLIDGFAKKMADQFFDNFKAQLEPGEAGASPETAPAVAAPAPVLEAEPAPAPAPEPAEAAPAPLPEASAPPAPAPGPAPVAAEPPAPEPEPAPEPQPEPEPVATPSPVAEPAAAQPVASEPPAPEPATPEPVAAPAPE